MEFASRGNKEMNKLPPQLLEEYFAIHLPYRLRILLAHYRMTRRTWAGDQAQVEAAFEASVITGRLLLHVLGIGRTGNGVGRPRVETDDVDATDLGTHPIDLSAIPKDDEKLFSEFIRMAHKASAHFTKPDTYAVEQTHIAITRICEYVKEHLFDKTMHRSVDIENHLASLRS
jgi:hypothetical protein